VLLPAASHLHIGRVDSNAPVSREQLLHICRTQRHELHRAPAGGYRYLSNQHAHSLLLLLLLLSNLDAVVQGWPQGATSASAEVVAAPKPVSLSPSCLAAVGSALQVVLSAACADLGVAGSACTRACAAAHHTHGPG
jgi:hypothetical protein